MKFNFKYGKKDFELDAKECRNVFSKTCGLMFRKKSKPLLFIFKKPTRQSVHSFFCKPFIAIWFNKDKIIDARVVKSGKILIKPLKKFDKLLEIPSNEAIFREFSRRK